MLPFSGAALFQNICQVLKDEACILTACQEIVSTNGDHEQDVNHFYFL